MATELTDLEVEEVSLVPKGANQMAKVALFKRGEEMTMGEKLAALFSKFLGSKEVVEVLKAEGVPPGCDHAELSKTAGDGMVTCPKCGAEVPMKKGKDMSDTTKTADEIAKANAKAEEIAKALEVEKAARLDLEKRLKASEDADKLRTFIAKAAAFPRIGMKVDDLGSVLKTISEKAPEVLEKIEGVFKVCNEVISKSVLFKEVGSGGDGADGAMGQIEGIAKGLMAKDPTITFAKAMTQAATLNPKLADEASAKSKN